MHAFSSIHSKPAGWLVYAALLAAGGLCFAQNPAKTPIAQIPAKSDGASLPPFVPGMDAAPTTVTSADGTVEVGSIAGAAYRIDIPANWNHSLVVFYHGYSEQPYLFKIGAAINGTAGEMLARGYAVIESGYSDTGWAIERALPETEQLRAYFLREHGQPKESYVVGGSMGGALTMITIEQRPEIYNGALSLCGRLGPTDAPMQQRFAWRAAFDYYFPGLMPPLVPTPPDYVETDALRTKVGDALKANPTAAASMRGLTSLHTDADVARMMVYFTYIISDFQKKAGGNPFDNSNTIYSGTSPDNTASDNALNDGAHRYAADPLARQYLVRNYTPTGKLLRPMIDLHTTYDPLIPVSGITLYPQEVAAAGFPQNFVEQYVKRDGHCTMSAAEAGVAFDELLTWVHQGKRPVPGLLPGADSQQK